MSLDKAIKYKKEKRQPYRGAKANCYSCRNHGSCNYCESSRTIFDKRARMRLEGQEDEWFGYFNLLDPNDVDAYLYEERLKTIGVDPFDFETRYDLGI